jgi:uncharacterized Zn ribbon protein
MINNDKCNECGSGYITEHSFEDGKHYYCQECGYEWDICHEHDEYQT